MPTNTNQSRSGYARDIRPELLEADEAAGRTVPIADKNGVQEGVIPRTERVFGKAKYDVVTLDESDRRIHLRTIGELPLIQGGLDDNSKPEPKGTKKMKAVKKGTTTVATPKNKDFDPMGGDEVPEPGDPALVAEEEALAQQYSRAPALESEPVKTYVNKAPDKKDLYLSQRKRVTLELVDGSMGLNAIDVKQSRYGVTVILPMDGGMSFVPKPGSEINVSCGDNSWPCYFPGTYFELDELGIIGLIFVKAE